MGKEPDSIRQEIEETRARMGETVEAIGYRADVPSRAKESIANKKDSIVGSVKNTKDSIVGSIVGSRQRVAGSAAGAKEATMSQLSERTPSAEEMRHGARRAVGLAQENPLGLAIGSVALGFLVGLMVPSTDIEDEMIGPIADELKDKAKEAGQEAIDRGRQVAVDVTQSATEAAKSSAQEQTQEMALSVSDKASDVASSAQATAQERRPS